MSSVSFATCCAGSSTTKELALERDVPPIPEHLHTVTPRLVVRDGAAAIDFYARAFGAEEIGERFADPEGRVIHAEVRIGNSVVMITEEGPDADVPARSPESLGGVVSAIMATYWVEVDAVWERAVQAGAEILYPLADQFCSASGLRTSRPRRWTAAPPASSGPAAERLRAAGRGPLSLVCALGGLVVRQRLGRVHVT
jgi:PhnB protein